MERIRGSRNTLTYKQFKLSKAHHTLSHALTLARGAAGAADGDSVAGAGGCRQSRWEEGAILTCRGGACAAGHTEK